MFVKIISTMLENTYTTDDLVERLGLMRMYYAQRLFQGGSDITLQQSIGERCSQETLQALAVWQTSFARDGISPLVVYEALDAVEEDMEGIPRVMLYVPVHFSQEHVVRFGTWFREFVQPNILLTLRIDPRMAGGCGLVWNSIFYDFSLRYSVQQKRGELISLFNTLSNAR